MWAADAWHAWGIQNFLKRGQRLAEISEQQAGVEGPGAFLMRPDLICALAHREVSDTAFDALHCHADCGHAGQLFKTVRERYPAQPQLLQQAK